MRDFSRANGYSYTFRDYLNRTFLTMGLGLGISTIVAYLIALNPRFLYSSGLSLIACLAQLGLAFYFGGCLTTMSKKTAWICFIAYSALMGFSLSAIIFVYSYSSVVLALFTTTVLFFCMAFIGKTTNFDLTNLSSLFAVGLIAMIVVSLINTFLLHSSGVEMILCYVGIILFLGLIAYDVQRLRYFYSQGFYDAEMMEKAMVYGAFQLYLDFINLFLRILQFFGRRRND